MADAVRWGILGTGKIAKAFANALKEVPDAVLAAVASRSLDKAQAVMGPTGVDVQTGFTLKHAGGGMSVCSCSFRRARLAS